jgi:AcrR family transcriptional regulator
MKARARPDRRIARTRQLLLGSLIELILEKGYETITVQDIIDRANVGRSTFYSHFQDKEHLLLSGSERLRDVFEDFRSPSSREESGWSFSLALFLHAEEQRPVFKALLGKKAGTLVVANMRETLEVFLKEHFQRTWPAKGAAVPLDVLVQYLVSGFLGLLTWWLDRDISLTARQMNDHYRMLTEPAIRNVIGGDAAHRLSTPPAEGREAPRRKSRRPPATSGR